VNALLIQELASRGIAIMSEGQNFCLFVREGCLAMVPRGVTASGFAGIGSTGLSTDDGLLYLVWREEQPMLVGSGIEIPATSEQVEKVQGFSADLKAALGLE
jgi:hypothetical protein